MKKIVLGLLLLVMLTSLCGCSSSKYKKAVTYLNDGEYKSALVLFEELAEKDYKESAEMVKETKYQEADTYLNNGKYKYALALFEELAEKDYKNSAEMIKETKYQFVSNKKDEENLTVYEYLTELSEDNYKDSKEIYEELYAWKFDIAFSTSRQSMYHCDTVNASTKLLPFYYINLRITGGKPGEDLRGKYVIKWSNGQESKDSFVDGDGSVLSVTCSAAQSLLGKTVFSLYDNNGKLLASKSAIIK